MSLLMEALRKAEAAKNKVDGEDADDSSNLSLEPKATESETLESKALESKKEAKATESVPDEEKTSTSTSTENPQDHPEPEDKPDLEQVKFELELKPEDEKLPEEESELIEAPQTAAEIADELLDEDYQEDSFELIMDVSDELDTALPESDFANSTEEIGENTQVETLAALDQRVDGIDELSGYVPDEPNKETVESESLKEDFDAQEAEEELSQFERSINQPEEDSSSPLPDQAVIDRQTANSLFQAKENTQQNKRNRAALLVVLVALIPLGGGGFYWYYSSSLSNNALFPGNTSITSPPQGFLGDATAPDPADPVVIATNNPDIPVATDGPLTENIDLDAIVAVIEDAEASENILTDVIVDPSLDTEPTSELIAGNNQTIQADDSLVDSSFDEPTLDIRFTRTTSRPAVNPDLLAAYESYRQNDLIQARRLYAQVLDSQANNRDALLGLALINRQEGNIAQAQALYSRLLQLNPRDPLARAGLLESGQNTNATQQESQLRALQNEYPNVAPLAFALGNLFASQSRWNEAQNAYFDALLIANEVDSDAVSPDYAFNLAVSLERLNQLPLAYNYYQQALELSSSSPAGFNLDNLNQRMAYLEEVLQ